MTMSTHCYMLHGEPQVIVVEWRERMFSLYKRELFKATLCLVCFQLDFTNCVSLCMLRLTVDECTKTTGISLSLLLSSCRPSLGAMNKINSTVMFTRVTHKQMYTNTSTFKMTFLYVLSKQIYILITRSEQSVKRE